MIVYFTIKTYFIYNKNQNDNSNEKYKRVIYDVLLINGYQNNIISYSYMNHISNKIEQLKTGNLFFLNISYNNINPLIVTDFRVIILYRCPWTKQIEKALQLAKKLNKIIILDIDEFSIIPTFSNLNYPLNQENEIYNSTILKMEKFFKVCDSAIITTENLANVILKFFKNTFISPNVASNKMFELSQIAIKNKTNFQNRTDKIIIGYFSDNFVYKKDIKTIVPSLIQILKEFKHVQLLIIDEIEIPDELSTFKNRIEMMSLNDLRKIPEYLVNFDINIIPLEENYINSLKSEIVWVEASLLYIPTVASNYGIFEKIIHQGETGFLCSSNKEWYIALKTLILNITLRMKIGENAFNICKEKYSTISSGNHFSNYINSIAHKHIGFVLPGLGISGGVRVILTHASLLQDKGWDVDLFAPDNVNITEFQGHIFNVMNIERDLISSYYDVLVATMYTTLFSVLNYTKAKRKLYLVQNYETDFYNYGNNLKLEAEKTYSLNYGVEYITISKWCQNWLKEKYRHESKYAPNGINLTTFNPHRRNLNKSKIRILIEGDNSCYYKNVDESFKIVDKLDRNQFEIWYMSYNAPPKEWYKVDKFLNKIPFENVSQIYSECDILLKSSILESFSYPPLEMLSTGGFCVVSPNGGNIEYLKNEENCLFYQLGDIDSAVICIKRLILDLNLQKRLYENGIITSRNRNLDKIKKKIVELYE